ncbi:kinase [Roseobacter sp. HKCCD9010]|uniref:PfkB family carbohydrate kinase n=1 Tax=unclassified Roseobacter TaxID=196798 RepID=UPI001491F6BD|nr:MULTISPECIES: PfkB family carbohydrate kinase [unclassified Roseobacter]MBF9050369.1 kinase [Rhodobacterales bacterium HKCCD4356]NNV14294.1 kinase [Roseobacter sp. HKCCD7357]NNV18487.1 kinase [Roseobacter sp. HKCCD8768]NNV27914.1 kinase [Roseobacter sp. HKCCD8192]NNV32219.1 kinase [Roseobacter sp. HKCCD9061]
MSQKPDILCIGSVLWDMIGRSELPMVAGNDKPGRITRIPGGVALNIAMTLARFDLDAALLSVVGQDPDGTALLAKCGQLGLITEHMLIDPELPTDQYMAIEAQGSLIAAIADAHSLEAAGERILAPLSDGRLGREDAPWDGLIALDGNLTEALLARIAASRLFRAADIRLAPASPGKAERLRPLLPHEGTTIYVNCEEAGLITGTTPASAEEGAEALLRAGARRVLVTQGADAAVDATSDQMITRHPPKITPKRITGAGDTFMAAHIAAEARGASRDVALDTALMAAANYVAG